jgi:hypothetical protein
MSKRKEKQRKRDRNKLEKNSKIHILVAETDEVCIVMVMLYGTDSPILWITTKAFWPSSFQQATSNLVKQILVKEGYTVDFVSNVGDCLHTLKNKTYSILVLNENLSGKDDELIAIEQPINTKILENVNFLGFIDFIVRNKKTGRYRITDFKTSTKGWSKYQKADPVKNSQILLYKKFYAELLGISQDLIDVEFIILKRKLYENTDFVVPRISKHVPASGKPSVNKAWKGFSDFVESVFDVDGNYRTDVEYPKNPTKLCDWCEFKQRGICSGK